MLYNIWQVQPDIRIRCILGCGSAALDIDSQSVMLITKVVLCVCLHINGGPPPHLLMSPPDSWRKEGFLFASTSRRGVCLSLHFLQRHVFHIFARNWEIVGNAETAEQREAKTKL